MKFNKKTVERRKQKRIKIKESLFAIVNKPYPILGDITDISERGLAFRYPSHDKVPSIFYYINILRVEDDLQILNLPVKPKWDSMVSKTYRKKGIQFRQLSKRQMAQLRSIISDKGTVGP